MQYSNDCPFCDGIKKPMSPYSLQELKKDHEAGHSIHILIISKETIQQDALRGVSLN